MKKTIYLVQSCPKDEFRKAAKNGCPCEIMGLHGRVLPVWATKTKEEAISDCRNNNRRLDLSTIYFMTEIYLFD